MLSDCALAEQELLGELCGARFQQRLVEVGALFSVRK